jgi:transcriptional regulator with XRE-family HTH domain
LKSRIDQYVINKVREKRLALGLSQLELGHAIGVSPAFIGKVESQKNETHYNVNHLNRLAIVLGCSPQDFFPLRPFKDPA